MGRRRHRHRIMEVVGMGLMLASAAFVLL